MKTRSNLTKFPLIIMVIISYASALLAEAPTHQPCTVVTATSNSSDVPKAIPTIGTITSDLLVTSPGTYILDVDLNANIEHTFPADLDIKLISPSGSQVVVTTDNAGTNDNVFNGTLFDDQAEVPVTDKVYVTSTTATPLAVEGALGKFKGENPNGTWVLEIVDDVTGDFGNLTAWSLDITVCQGNIPGETKLETHSSTGPVNIIDNNIVNPAFSTITVANHPGKICTLELYTNITHSFPGDLDITLEAPDGKKTTISTDNAGTNDNVFSNTNFRDSGDELVTDAIYSVGIAKDNIVPEGALSRFDGIDPNGQWKLIVADDAAIDTGTINSWSLTVKTCGTDEDQDNVSDEVDNCPDVPNTIQTDTDSDGFGDACDECSDNPNKSLAGACGCAVVDVDTDSDGTFDCNETCVSDPNKTSPGICGCGIADQDANNSGIMDCLVKQEAANIAAKLSAVKFSTKAKKIKAGKEKIAEIQALIDALNANVQANSANFVFTAGNDQATVTSFISKLKKLVKKVKGGYRKDKATFNKRKKNAGKTAASLVGAFNS